uniref:(northern house mosquito) hypothetical protein n=1 Tax=Culex pipiens TaxID=7175 RepID=A0A8D8CVQ6_CULPI
MQLLHVLKLQLFLVAHFCPEELVLLPSLLSIRLLVITEIVLQHCPPCCILLLQNLQQSSRGASNSSPSPGNAASSECAYRDATSGNLSRSRSGRGGRRYRTLFARESRWRIFTITR